MVIKLNEVRIQQISCWIAAISVVGSYYANNIFPFAPVSEASIIVLSASLIVCIIFNINNINVTSADLKRSAGRFLLLVSILGMCASTINGAIIRGLSIRDWAIFYTSAIIPLIIIGIPRRLLIEYICVLCVFFSILDVVANLSALMGWISLTEAGGRMTADFRIITRYPGLSGSTLAAGGVAFVAMTYLAIQLRGAKRGWGALVLAATMMAIGIGLLLIDARRYTAMTVVSVSIILLIRRERRMPLPIVAIGFGLLMLSLTFMFPEGGNDLRGRLYINGWNIARENLLIGEGLRWRDYTGAVATYWSLSQLGVTESGFLDLAISCGMLTAIFFVSGALFGVSGSRKLYTVPSVLAAMFTAEMAFGGGMGSLLTSILFYSSLLSLLIDEPAGIKLSQARVSSESKGRHVWTPSFPHGRQG